MNEEFDFCRSPIPPGLTVIEASAGTGKTHAISHLVPRLLLDGTVDRLGQVLLVTFTRDAARELAERVRRVLLAVAAPPTPGEPAGVADLRALAADRPGAPAVLARALGDLDLLTVCTIHSFCQRTLQQEGALCGLPVMPEVITDDTDLLEPILRRHWTELLAQDPVPAALSVQQGWQLADAIRFVNEHRRRPDAGAEPPVDPFPALHAALRDALGTLRGTEATTALARLGQVAKWTKGGPADTAEAEGWVRNVAAWDPAAPGFWAALKRAATLPEFAGRGNAAARTAAAALAGDPWIQATAATLTLLPRLHWSWLHQLAQKAVAELDTELARRRLLTQDGLIGRLHAALHQGDPAAAAALAARLGARHRVALIDESQDTDPRQLAIFRRAFLEGPEPGRLVLVGDPKQAIYGFRGANLGTYLGARDAAARRYTLTRTYRAPAGLVSVVNALFQQPGSFRSPRLTFPPATSAFAGDLELVVDGRPCSRLEVWLAPEETDSPFASGARRKRELAARIASTIRQLVAGGARLRRTSADGTMTEEPVHPGHFAVLVATNAQAEAVAEALQARHLPAVVNSGADVCASPVARDLLAVLTAVLDPRRKHLLRAALATRLVGLGAGELAALRLAGGPGTDLDAGAAWLELFLEWQRRWREQGLAALFAAFETPRPPRFPLGCTRRLARHPLHGPRHATDYRHLTDLLLEAARHEAPRPDGLVRWLAARIARAEEESPPEEYQLQLASDRASVQVLTMHKAKGLEFPLVFCPGLAEPTRVGEPFARDAAGDGGTTLVNLRLLDEATRKERKTALAAPALEEGLRLAYVALTRARARLWTCSFTLSPQTRAVRVSPLDWLLRAPEPPGAAGGFAAWVDQIKDGRAARHAAALAALAHPGITVVAPPAADDTRLAPAAATRPDAPVVPVAPAPPLPTPWRVTSFSRLTGEKNPHGPPAPAPAATAEIPAPASALAFLGVPGGADLGTVVHEWIQAWDFRPVDRAALRRHLAEGLPLPPRAPGEAPWEEVLAELLGTLRTARLPGCGPVPLARLCPEAHASEWHFHLPLAGPLTPGRLADCFAAHAAPEHRGYAARLRQLSAPATTGLLQGFIDRLVRHGDTWGVIDWKTNLVGRDVADYGEEALLEYAMGSHYFLQCHLYLVALRRHLAGLGLAPTSARQAWLVFLRGLAPDSPRGVLHLTPPEPLLAALDACFAPPAP